jgi:hypothetical protein
LIEGVGENLEDEMTLDNTVESLEDYNPGESVIKPTWMGFTYSEKIDSDDCSMKLPTIRRKKKVTLKRKIQKVINEDIDEIIEILSSPEKSPFKWTEPWNTPSTPPSTLKKARRQLLRDETVSPIQESVCISSESESESTSLPSIDSAVFEVKTPPSSPRLPLTSSPSSPLEVLDTEDIYYQNDPTMPIYKRSSKGIDTKEVVQTLLHIQDESGIAKNIPSHINENVSFMYSIKFIGHWKNVLCDGMGSWKQTGKHINTVHFKDIWDKISNEMKDDLKTC